MEKKNKTIKKTTSCGALAWRIVGAGELEVLLIKQFAHKDSWGIPKGHTHEGESIEHCARRETKEETGINVVLGQRLSPVTIDLKNEQKTVVVFLAQQVGNEPPTCADPDCEVADVRWFKSTALPTIQLYQRPIIEEGLRMLAEMMSVFW